MTAARPQAPSPAPQRTDDAYKTWLGHTYACARCRNGAAECPEARRLGRAWRAS
ncbi:hypothetical protein [Streptomyces sp. NPDC007346]|uniref:hypothetical protein n=1 Tax=Streptomyces sp. NPDC007346 TaxID=3154682 RepID=UPI0034562774